MVEVSFHSRVSIPWSTRDAGSSAPGAAVFGFDPDQPCGEGGVGTSLLVFAADGD